MTLPISEANFTLQWNREFPKQYTFILFSAHSLVTVDDKEERNQQEMIKNPKNKRLWKKSKTMQFVRKELTDSAVAFLQFLLPHSLLGNPDKNYVHVFLHTFRRKRSKDVF